MQLQANKGLQKFIQGEGQPKLLRGLVILRAAVTRGKWRKQRSLLFVDCFRTLLAQLIGLRWGSVSSREDSETNYPVGEEYSKIWVTLAAQ